MLVASVTADLDNDWKDETITVFAYEGGGPLHVAFTFVGRNAFQPTTFVVRNLVVGQGGAPAAVGGQLELEAGDFNNDGYPELVLGFLDKSGQLQLFQWDLRIEDTGVWPAGVAKLDRDDPSPCNGCFKSESELRQLFALATRITVPEAPTYDLSAPPTAGSTRVDSPGFSYALAVGDIGLGFDVLVASWIAGTNTVAWGVFQQADDGLALAGDVMALRDVDHAHAVSLALGNFEGTGSRELALGIVDWNTISVYLYTIDQTVRSLPMTMAKLLTVAEDSWMLNANVNLRLVAGDLNDDLDDELVVGFTLGAEAYLFQVDALTCGQAKCMELVGSSGYAVPTGRVPTTTTRSPELKLAIGNVDESSTNELVVAVEYTSTTDQSVHKVMLVSLTAQPDSNQPFLINGRHCYAGPAYRESEDQQEVTVNNMALSVGNLYGLGYRVGTPKTVRFESVPELLAVVNAPPTHYDVLDGEEIAVNQRTLRGYGSFTKLTNADGVSSNFEITRDTVAIESTASGNALDGKLAVVVGKLHQSASALKKNAVADGRDVMERLTVSRELTASGDDAVLYISTTRDQWKFPIIDQKGTSVGALDVWLSSSCGVACVQVADGRDLWWFAPDHEPFNVLTYSSRSPTDFVPSNRVMVGDRVTLGPNDHTQVVGQHSGRSQSKATLDHQTSTRSSATAVGIDVNYEFMFSQAFLGLGPNHKLPLGISVNAMKSEDEETASEEATSHKVSAAIERDVAVQAYLEPINPEFAYRVQPFVWLARTADGHEYLKVEYTAEPGYHPGVATWWQRTYNRPDPAFNLPWWWAATFKRDRTMLTKDLVATPQFPSVGELVHVTATVRNKALVEARQVDVSFWRGNPDNCFDLACLTVGRTLIGSAKIGFIPAQGKREVSFLMRYDGVQNIHVTLDDNEQIDEMHEDNNHAYALLFHNVREGGYTLETLRLGRTDPVRPLIDVVPRTEADGSFGGGYTVSATVVGDTFTRQNLVAQFWHGAVGVGGRLIATIAVPLLNGSVETATPTYELRAYWHTASPDLHGHEQELHAVLLHSGFDPTPANVISHVSRRVSVMCFGVIDLCGVCGGSNRSCAGCDGEPHSGVVVDACGVCGGDNSTCCVPRPGQAKLHRVRLSADALASAGGADDQLVKRVQVGELVVWENLFDWEAEIVAGLGLGSYEHLAAAFNLSAVRDHDQSIPLKLPLAEDLPSFIQKYVSMLAVKDHVDSAPSDDEIQIPQPDSTTKYLRQSPTSARWRITSAGDFAPVAPVKRETADDLFAEDDYNFDGEVREYAMSDVCCAPADDGDDDGDEWHEARDTADIHDDYHELPTAGRPLRSQLLSMLKDHKRKLDRLRSVVNATGTLNPGIDQAISRLRAEATASTFFVDPAPDAPRRPIRCLCPPTTATRQRRTSLGSLNDLYGRFAYTDLTGRSEGNASVLAPGGASMPHRFFTPGVYLWHDARHPAVRGAIVVEPSRYAPDACGVCGGDNTGCRDCAGVVNGLAKLDECGQCAGGTTGRWPGEAKDCAGVCFGDARVGDCDVCEGGTTDEPVGRNRQDCNHVCFGTAILDFCGVCSGGITNIPINASLDCAGECFGQAYNNSCGFCVGGSLDVPTTLGADCFDVCGGPATYDCAGTCNGTATLTPDFRCIGGRTGFEVPQPNKRRVTEDEGQCTGAVVDARGLCCAPEELDCAGMCFGSATLDCDVCVGGASGVDPITVRDCAGTCNGTARINPCGVCALPEHFAAGPDYWVDCAGSCNGSAVLDNCGVCVGGFSRVPLYRANKSMDCQGTCFGNATLDACGVCYVEGDGHVPDSDKDCAGVCGGEAVVDECGQCAMGTTKRAFNADKDCAGQCFGKRSASDPACTCAPGELDACFVCGGDNSSCRGCDGVLHSGLTRDLCGVCGGNSSTCCFLPFAQVHVIVRGFETLPPHRTLDAGETLVLTNLHAGRPYTFVLVRLGDHTIEQRFASLEPGRTLRTEIAAPGEYALTALDPSTTATTTTLSALATVRLTVRYNSKRRDACGHCVYTSADVDAEDSSVEVAQWRRELVAYTQCCEAMGSDNVHAWYANTHLVDPVAPTVAHTIVERTGHYRSAPTRHLLRLVAPQTIDADHWNAVAGQQLAVGDVIVMENRDMLDHVIAIDGPQPVPDVVLDRGTSVVVGPLLTPGTYQVVSVGRNLVNTSFAVEFAFACVVHAPMAAPSTAPAQLPPTGGGSLLGIPPVAAFRLGMLVLGAVGGLVAWYIKSRRVVVQQPVSV